MPTRNDPAPEAFSYLAGRPPGRRRRARLRAGPPGRPAAAGRAPTAPAGAAWPRRDRQHRRRRWRSTHDDHSRQRLPEDLGQAPALEDELRHPAGGHGRPQHHSLSTPSSSTSRAAPPSISETRDARAGSAPSRRRGLPRPGPPGGGAHWWPGRPPSPETTSRPWSMIVTDSQRSSTRSSWWLEKSTQHPARACSTSTSPMASMPVGSRPASGSSRTSSSGSCTRAAASCTRCWLPCDRLSTLSRHGRRPEAIEPLHRRSGGGGGRHPVEPAEVLELLGDQHARVEPAFLGHVAEATALGGRPGAVPPHRAGVEIGQPEDGPHRGRLAGAVRAEEADDLAGGNREGQIVERGERAEVAGQAVELEQSRDRVRLRDAAHRNASPSSVASTTTVSPSW